MMEQNRIPRPRAKLVILTVALLLASQPGWPSGSGHAHGPEKKSATATAEEHHGGGLEGGHRHNQWQTPPAGYESRQGDRWADLAAIQRGRQLYRQNCLGCHGADGKGAGPAAAALPHPPADLSNHFHRAPGDGDGYLFWRVSEGGAVEPFKSMQSTMPAFKNSLTEDQRWDVLAYVHAYYHLGLTEWGNNDPRTDAAGAAGAKD